MSSTYNLERVISSLFILIYCLRSVPDDNKEFHTLNLPVLCCVISLVAIFLLTVPIPKPSAMTAYLFFLLHALNIYKEYAKAGTDDGTDHVWQVKYVFAVLLAIATSIFYASSQLPSFEQHKPGGKQDDKYIDQRSKPDDDEEEEGNNASE